MFFRQACQCDMLASLPPVTVCSGAASISKSWCNQRAAGYRTIPTARNSDITCRLLAPSRLCTIRYDTNQAVDDQNAPPSRDVWSYFHILIKTFSRHTACLPVRPGSTDQWNHSIRQYTRPMLHPMGHLEAKKPHLGHKNRHNMLR